MQQTSGSSFLNRTVGDESAVDEVAVDEVPVVVAFFLLMVCGNCDRSSCLGSTVVVVFYGDGEMDVIGDRINFGHLLPKNALK